MLKDYSTPSFKTPPKKPAPTSSKTMLLNSTPFITSSETEVSIEEIERKVWEAVNFSRKQGVSPEKLEEIKENAYKDVIRSTFYCIFAVLSRKRPENRDIQACERARAAYQGRAGEHGRENQAKTPRFLIIFAIFRAFSLIFISFLRLSARFLRKRPEIHRIGFRQQTSQREVFENKGSISADGVKTQGFLCGNRETSRGKLAIAFKKPRISRRRFETAATFRRNEEF